MNHPITREELERWQHDYAALAANVYRLLAALTAAEGMREALNTFAYAPQAGDTFLVTVGEIGHAKDALAAFDAQVAR